MSTPFESDLVKKLNPYLPVQVLSQLLYEKNNPSIKIDWNESTVNPSPLVIEQMIQFITHGKLYLYPPSYNAVLIAKICEYNNQCLGSGFIFEPNIQTFAGADSVLEYATRAFINKEEAAVLVSPTYDNMRMALELCGAHIHRFVVTEETNFQLNGRELAEFIQKTAPKIVYVCNPNNPTTTKLEESELIYLIKNFQNVLFIIDESYYEFSHLTVARFVNTHANLLIIRSFSKAFALAGLRIGYAIAHASLIQSLSKIKNPKSVSSLAQVAAIAALTDISYLRNRMNEVHRAKELLVQIAHQFPDFILKCYAGGNFALLKVRQKGDLLKWMRSQEIYVRDLEHLPNLTDYFRITIGTADEIQKVMNCIMAFYAAASEGV